MALTKEDNQLILGAGLLAVAYFGIIRPITNTVGLTTSAKEKALQEVAETASKNQGWNPSFYKTYLATHSGLIKTDAAITAIAKQINGAFGFFNDNVNTIYAAFRQLNSQVDLSWLCAKYSALYKQDLLTRLKAPWYYLKDGLTPGEFNEVSKIVNALPVNKK